MQRSPTLYLLVWTFLLAILALGCPTPEEQAEEARTEVQQALETGRRATVSRGLSAWVPYTAKVARLIPVVLEIEADGRVAHQGFYPEVLPLHASVRGDRLQLTVTAVGKIGYSHVTRQGDPGGQGFGRPDGRSVTLGGSLLVGDDQGRVSDAMISATPTSVFEERPVCSQDVVSAGRSPDWLAAPAMTR